MLREEIKLKLNEALKNKDKKCTSTLRLVLAAMKDRDIAARSKGNNSGISEDEIKLLLQTMIKQRKESSQIYEKAGREDLLIEELDEIKIISNFLPKQMSEEEIKNAQLNLAREKAEVELIKLHPDFYDIKSSDEFHEWVDKQDDMIKNWLYNHWG